MNVWTLLNPFSSSRHVLVSPLPPDACAERLREHLVTLSERIVPFARPPGRTLDGTVSEHGFSVVRYRAWQRNSFRPVATGTFTQTPSGTQIDVRFALNPITMIFMVVWGAGAMFLTIGTLPWLAGLAASAPWQSTASVIVMMPLVAVVMPLVGRWWARGDEAFLLGQFREACDAADADPTPAAP